MTVGFCPGMKSYVCPERVRGREGAGERESERGDGLQTCGLEKEGGRERERESERAREDGSETFELFRDT